MRSFLSGESLSAGSDTAEMEEDNEVKERP